MLHPWGAATVGLAAVTQACELMVDVTLPPTATALAAGGQPLAQLAGLAVALVLPPLLAPTRRAAQSRWRACAQQRATLAMGASALYAAPLAPLLRDSVDLAADTVEAICPVAVQGCMMAAGLDGAGRLGIALGALTWGAGVVLTRQVPSTQNLMARASQAAARMAVLTPRAAGLLALWQAQGAAASASTDMAATLSAAVDGVDLACPAVIISAVLPRTLATLTTVGELVAQSHRSRL